MRNFSFSGSSRQNQAKYRVVHLKMFHLFPKKIYEIYIIIYFHFYNLFWFDEICCSYFFDIGFEVGLLPL